MSETREDLEMNRQSAERYQKTNSRMSPDGCWLRVSLCVTAIRRQLFPHTHRKIESASENSFTEITSPCTYIACCCWCCWSFEMFGCNDVTDWTMSSYRHLLWFPSKEMKLSSSGIGLPRRRQPGHLHIQIHVEGTRWKHLDNLCHFFSFYPFGFVILRKKIFHLRLGRKRRKKKRAGTTCFFIDSLKIRSAFA